MLFRVKQEICLHLSKVRCLASNPSGRFNLRFHIYQRTQTGKNFAIPVNAIEINKQKQSTYQIMDNTYTTKTFIMKTDAQMIIDQLCVFKIQTDMFTEDEDDNRKNTLQLVCEIIQSDYGKQKIAGVFEGKINGYNINQCLLIDFYDYSACQVLGTIHSCTYQYEYQPIRKQFTTFQSFCKTQSKQYVEFLINHLYTESKKVYTKINENYQAIQCLLYNASKYIKQKNNQQGRISFNSEKMISQLKQQQAPKKYNSHTKLEQQQSNDKRNKQIQSCQTQPDTQRQQNIGITKRKRKRIFGSRPRRSAQEQKKIDKVSIDQFQLLIHQNSLAIYEKWKNFIAILMSKESHRITTSYYLEYMIKIKKLMGESIVRFKGSWDIDHYSTESNQRNKMAMQIRSMTQQNQIYTNQFKFYNKTFYSKNRPIYFQEGAVTDQNEEMVNIQESIKEVDDERHIIFLVHGLGACRLDLQKLKVELKRYYPNQGKIVISHCNQGRTQGNIDNMGIRLASEVSHYLSKCRGVQKISFIGHSMGGVIIRSALPRLEMHSNYFYSLITLSSPHIGYNYSNSKLVDAGLWVINNWQKCQSILQLTLSDKQKSEQCFLYKLSEQPGLQWFKKITFVGSHQDLYVPYYSARIQKHHQCLEDHKRKVQKGIIHNQMIDNILNRIKCDLTRIDVNFYIPQQNIDNLIGRAAHISFIQNIEMLRIFILMSRDLLF